MTVLTRNRAEVPDLFVLLCTGPVLESVGYGYRQWTCPECGRYPGQRIGHPRIRFTNISEALDFVSADDGVICRGRVFDLLLSRHIDGWRQGRVDVVAAERVPALSLDYSELIVLNKAKDYPALVGLQKKFECQTCGRTHYVKPALGVEVPREVWDGSDIFRIRELGLIVVTSYFREAVLGVGFSGIDFVPIADWHIGI